MLVNGPATHKTPVADLEVIVADYYSLEGFITDTILLCHDLGTVGYWLLDSQYKE